MDVTSLGGESSGIASIIRFIIFRRIATKPARCGLLCAKSLVPHKQRRTGNRDGQEETAH